MSAITNSQSNTFVPPNVGNSNVQNEVHQDEPPKFVAKSDAEARASQARILSKIQEKALVQREITVDNAISRDGLTAALGRASGYAKLKDAMMRGAYKAGNRHTANAAFGSLHKSALRLAEKYHQQVKDGASQAECLATLEALKDKLTEMKDKRIGNATLRGQSPEDAAKSVTRMLEYVEHEISQYPSVHLEKATKLWLEDYPQMKQDENISSAKKLATLEDAYDHLKAAIEGGAGGVDGHDYDRMLEDIGGEVGKLKFKKELEDKVAKKDLKPVRTRVHDPVENQRQKHLRDKVLRERLDTNLEHELDQMELNGQIRSFDRQNLRHVKTDERTGLKDAQERFAFDSMMDEWAPEVNPLPKGNVPRIKEANLEHLSAHTLNSDSFNNMGARLKKAVKDKDMNAIQALAAELGERMADDVSQRQDAMLGIITSKGAGLKNDLLHALANQLEGKPGPLEGNYSEAPKLVQKFLDLAYRETLDRLPDRYIGPDSIMIGGVVYTQTRTIGEGAFGDVHLYQGVKDGEIHEIVVKVPKLKDEITAQEVQQVFNESAHEARAHWSLSQGGHPNITGFVGAIQPPGGGVLLAMEYASLGRMHEFQDTLMKAQNDGRISQRAADLIRLTLMKDMVKGVQHLQETAGMTHLDIKPPNTFLSPDGQALIGDFGLADFSSERHLEKRLVDSADYLAPEMITRNDERKRIQDQIANLKKKLPEKARTEAATLGKKDGKDLVKQIEEQVEALAELEKNFQTYQVEDKADTWALGVCAYELFHNRRVPQADGVKFVYQVDKNLADFSSDTNNRIRPLGQDQEGNAIGAGVGAVDRLLNLMMHPDPGQRPSINALLVHSAFNEPGVGEPEVRTLIQLLAKNDDTEEGRAKLKAAVKAVEQVV